MHSQDRGEELHRMLLSSIIKIAFSFVLSSRPQQDNLFRMSSQAKVSAEWDAMAGEWDDLAVGYKDAFVKLMWEYTELENKAKDLVVLDFGCGTGLLTEDLRTRVSEVVCIDAAPLMIQQLQEKIRAGEWENVRSYCAVLGDPESIAQSKGLSSALEELRGKVDLICASSVLSFIPSEDVSETMKVLGQLLRPGGVLCHSDWPVSDQHPDGFTDKKARQMYEYAGLQLKATGEVTVKMDSEHESPVFIGVAVKH